MFVIRGSVFPTTEHDANPLVGYCPNRRMMGQTLCGELVIEGSGPLGVVNRLSGEFMKALANELGASQTPVDPAGLATAFGDRSNPGKIFDLRGAFETVPVGTKG